MSITIAAMSLGAQAQHRKLLTMEDAILNRELIPQRHEVRWDKENPGCFLSLEEGKWYRTNARTGVRTECEKPAPRAKQAHGELRDNNIVWVEADGSEVKVTDFQDPNIVSGQAVSRHEFGISGGMFLSPDEKMLAFYQKDESEVSSFPLMDIRSRTGKLKMLKYPMAGMASEKIRTGIWNSETRETIYLDVTDFDAERYHTNLSWTPDSKYVILQVLDRSQKRMNMNLYSAQSGEKLKTILSEHNDRYVEPLDPVIFLDSDPTKFIYRTNNRDSYRNLYLVSLEDSHIERLTRTDADVEYLGQAAGKIFYYSREVSPVEQHLFSVDLKSRRQTRLTFESGMHRCKLSPDGKWFSDEWSSLNVPRKVAIRSTDAKHNREIFSAPDPCKEYNFCPIELGTVRSADGKYDNWYRLVRPLDFDPQKKYPVIVYVYGGPHSQMVNNSFQANLRRWEMYMAQHGYVVFVMDNRGTQYRGLEYEQAIHRQCGKCEMEDQVAGLRWLMKNPWVDSSRIGVHGWSYGGFMTISLITNYPELFKVAVAGGPVIDWKWYEVMYGERYMDSPQTNAEGYQSTELIAKAKDLKGKLLICQGALDDTVLWIHSLSFVQECVKEHIQVDYFPYPIALHNVMGRDRVHLMQKVTDYFDEWL